MSPFPQTWRLTTLQAHPQGRMRSPFSVTTMSASTAHSVSATGLAQPSANMEPSHPPNDRQEHHTPFPLIHPCHSSHSLTLVCHFPLQPCGRPDRLALLSLTAVCVFRPSIAHVAAAGSACPLNRKATGLADMRARARGHVMSFAHFTFYSRNKTRWLFSPTAGQGEKPKHGRPNPWPSQKTQPWLV